jgi:hypothetical protein
MSTFNPNNQELVVVFAPGARGDFLGRLLMDDLDYDLAFTTHTKLRFVNFCKVHFHLANDIELICPKNIDCNTTFSNIDQMFDYFNQHNLYSVRIHSGNDLQAIIAWTGLSAIKHSTPYTIEHAQKMEVLDEDSLHRYSAIIDFRDLWSKEQIAKIVKTISNRLLTASNLVIIENNIIRQPFAENTSQFLPHNRGGKNDLPSVTQVNIPT